MGGCRPRTRESSNVLLKGTTQMRKGVTLVFLLSVLLFIGCSEAQTSANKLNEMLLAAAKAGDVSKVKSLVNKGADVNARTRDMGWSPLHLAIGGGHGDVADLVGFLVAHGAEVNAADREGQTPLHMAAGTGNMRAIELLVAHGATIDQGDGTGRTPLHWAAIFDQIAAGKMLLKKGASANVRSKVGLTPLHWAAKTEIAEVLIKNGADLNVRGSHAGWTPLHHAVSFNRLGIVRVLVRNGADVNVVAKDGKTALDIAEGAGHREIASFLREHGGRATRTYPSSKLVEALRNEDIKTANDLLTQGVDVNARGEQGYTALYWAAYKGNTQMAETLISKGANVNETVSGTDDTALHAAVMNVHLDMVKFLVSKGANVNAGDWYSRAPLHWAASRGRKEIADFLIENGAKVNAQMMHGETPLLEAATRQGKSNEVVELLIANGATVTFHIAAALGWKQRVEEFLAGGVDVNAPGPLQATALHFAAKMARKDIVALLLARGANVNAVDATRKTPMDWARDDNIKGFLAKYGGRSMKARK